NWSDVTNHAALLGGNLDQAAAWAAIASTAGYRGSAGRGEIGDYLGRRLAADPYDAAATAALNLGGAVNADLSLADDVLAKIAVAKQLGYAGGWLPGQFEAYYRAAPTTWRAAYDGAVQTYTGWERPVVRAYAAGGEITGGVTGRDSALVLAMPGERILSLRQAEQMDAIHAAAVRQAGGVSVAVDLAPVAAAFTAGSAATIRAIDASAARVVGAVDALGGEVARLNRAIADQGREIARLTAIVGRLAA
ncbi:MAG TPA: hypothetical protein PKZ97_12785, partial [Azospirillaceae bacterium]|nr:hypothetical protein [Azospirillaceae bacterium]